MTLAFLNQTLRKGGGSFAPSSMCTQKQGLELNKSKNLIDATNCYGSGHNKANHLLELVMLPLFIVQDSLQRFGAHTNRSNRVDKVEKLKELVKAKS